MEVRTVLRHFSLLAACCCQTETVVAISGGNYLTPQYRTDGLVISAMVLVSRPPRTATGPRVHTREPDIVTQLTRGNMKVILHILHCCCKLLGAMQE